MIFEIQTRKNLVFAIKEKAETKKLWKDLTTLFLLNLDFPKGCKLQK